jgi:hypothetical protein
MVYPTTYFHKESEHWSSENELGALKRPRFRAKLVGSFDDNQQSTADTRLHAQKNYADDVGGKEDFSQKCDLCAAKRTDRKTCGSQYFRV